MFFPPIDIVNRVKEQYPAGSRVELISMNDPYRDIPSGTTEYYCRTDADSHSREQPDGT